MLREARQLVEQRAGAKSSRVTEQPLVSLMGEPVRDDRAALSHYGLAQFAWTLTCEQKREPELAAFLRDAFEDGR